MAFVNIHIFSDFLDFDKSLLLLTVTLRGYLISAYCLFLAHLSQRLIGELIVYSCSGVRPSVVVRRRPQFQASSSPKPLARSKANFMWSLLG